MIQAGRLAKGCEVFVGDVGEPARIDDLTRLMVRLMGLEVLGVAIRMRNIESIQTVLMWSVADYKANTCAIEVEKRSFALGTSRLRGRY